jgi:hypothetical protein
MKVVRGITCAFFLLAMIYNLEPYTNHEPVLDKEECIRDYTFVYTDQINFWLTEHKDFKKRYMIYAGFLMDFTQISGVIFFNFKFNTTRTLWAFIIFMIMRLNVQNIFFLGRPAGFLWEDPGMPAITVPYADTNDFYYSGHIGTCFLYMSEMFINGQKVMGFLILFILLNEWAMLMFIRTHYCIDMISGLFIAHQCLMWGERFSYFFDTKVMGWDHRERTQCFHTPCKQCGWSN